MIITATGELEAKWAQTVCEGELLTCVYCITTAIQSQRSFSHNIFVVCKSIMITRLMVILYAYSASHNSERAGITAYIPSVVLLLTDKAHYFCSCKATVSGQCAIIISHVQLVLCNVCYIMYLCRSPVKCGSVIRLTHLNTNRNLHSHHFQSPLSRNLEVSAFGDSGEGDEGMNVEACSYPYQHWLELCRSVFAVVKTLSSITIEYYSILALIVSQCRHVQIAVSSHTLSSLLSKCSAQCNVILKQQ